MAYRRGFKTEATATALEVRAELGLGPLERLDPRLLAEYLDIPIWDLTDLAARATAALHLVEVEPEVFSAVTVFRGTERTIVHNNGHAPARQNSNIAHELAHGLLLHPPTPALDNKGCRDWDQDLEDEATWLASALLVTEAAALEVAFGRMSREDAMMQLRVSGPMLQMRLNATGALKRAARWRANR